ncbi:META domain-containing protein [Anaeromyxobacter oryzae]|uniref:DUF306 domain-containing protein n=1 Tax=Anaeromyxobacter oryzae TaxID=2918170 RepID=A0ABM7WUF9_9BACT|nr:META domain-containing protein [Anaeromyxobacter oryzae]BDG03126.1 hypothetical protein AMOR_21220 [Anaeromyxobacter oryzae]
MRRAARVTISVLLLAAACAAPERVAPPAVAAPGVRPAQPTIVGTTWLWGQTIDPERSWVPADPARYTLELGGDGTVDVLADCNRGRGRYAHDGSRLEIGPLATTRMACPPGSLDDRYLKQVAGIRSVAVVAGLLRADLLADSGTMWFVAERDALAASYACADGKRAWVVYTPGRARVLAGPDVLDLAELTSGSGARYRAGEITWFTKGTEAFLERAGAKVLADCHIELRAGPSADRGTPQGHRVGRALVAGGRVPAAAAELDPYDR